MRCARRAARAHLQGLAAGSRAAHADEQPRPRGGRATRTTWSSTAAPARRRATGRPSTRSSRRCAGSKTTRRCWCSRASRSACADARMGAARADRELEPRARVGDLGAVPQARGARADDVRADDGGLVDLHRHAGDPAGHVRDVRGDRARSTSAARWRATISLTAGLGGMGGAQPLAVTMNDGVALVRRGRPGQHRAPPRARATSTSSVDDLDEALRLALDARDRREAAVDRRRSATRPRSCRGSRRRGVPIDIVTDQTSAHDPLDGYIPQGLTLAEAAELRAADAAEYIERAQASMAAHCAAMLAFQDARRGRLRLRQQPARARPSRRASRDAFAYPGFVPAYIRPLFCEGKGPFRWVALSGDPDDIAATDAPCSRCSPTTSRSRAGSGWRASGSRSRACPRGSAGSATASGTGRAAVQRDGRERRAPGADRDRPRPPRLRLRRLARTARPRR